MRNQLLLLAIITLIGGLTILYRFWERSLISTDKEVNKEKIASRIHSLIIGFSSLMTGIVILLYIIFY